MFERERDFLKRVEVPGDVGLRRRPLDDDRLNALVEKNPGLPADFVAYLREIGPGPIRDNQFQVYGELRSPAEVLDDDLDLARRVLCFGDDFSGDAGGFLPDDGWKVVEIWADSSEIKETGQSFRQFIQEQMWMGADGSDLRGEPDDPISTGV